MDPVRPQMREQLTRDCASLDWSTDPHQTPSGGSRALTPDRSKTPATGLYSNGIDTREPVTEEHFHGRWNQRVFRNGVEM